MHHYNLLPLFLLSIHSLTAMMMNPYGMQQPTGLGGALSMSMQQHNTKEAFKEQRKGAQDIDSAVDKFKRWLIQENILTGYKDLMERYQANVKRENNYVAYMKASAANGMIKAPAGYRLPENRGILPPLGEVMKKYNEVTEILDIHKSVAAAVTNKFSEVRHISELTDMINDYRGKYLDNIRVGQAPPEIVKQVAASDALVTNLETQVSQVRDGFSNYLTDIGGITQDALSDDKNDLKDMADAVEEILAKETSGKQFDDNTTLGDTLSSFIAARYNNLIDDQHNPFTMPLKTTSDKVIGIPAKELQEAMANYREELLTAAKKIRDRAVPKTAVIGKPDVYFDPTMIPPDIATMETTNKPHRYAFPGYLGYWLQHIINHLHEIKLLGADIIDARVKLLDFSDKLFNECLMPVTMYYPDLAHEPIMKDVTVNTINLDSIQNILQANPNNLPQLLDLATKTYKAAVTANQKTIDRIKDKAPEVLTFTSDKYPNGVTELAKLRRTMLLIAMLAAYAQQQEFAPDTYTSDLFGDIQDPNTLFPQPTDVHATSAPKPIEPAVSAATTPDSGSTATSSKTSSDTTTG